MTRSDDVVREVDARDLEAAGAGVRALLADGVASDASLGFLGPLDDGLAQAWLAECLAEVAAGRRRVWLAFDVAGGVSGMVHLAYATKQNAPHRGEVQKLVVRGDARGRGLGARLMTALEAGARAAGRWLLILDTDADSAAVAFYAKRGWTPLGVIPFFCLSPAGELQGTHVFWRDLRDAAHD
jgi:GNAT superfamily N-acetyltransferase